MGTTSASLPLPRPCCPSSGSSLWGSREQLECLSEHTQVAFWHTHLGAGGSVVGSDLDSASRDEGLSLDLPPRTV